MNTNKNMETFSVKVDSVAQAKLLIEIAEHEGLVPEKHTNPHDAKKWDLIFYRFPNRDYDFCHGWFKNNHLEDFTFSEFRAALRGEYEFTRPQPFDNLNGREVVFEKDGVKIGCKFISRDDIYLLNSALQIVEKIHKQIVIKYGSENLREFIKQAYKYYYG